tara:strand:- start:1907 stop:2134 length:228 start_codon:yes stop_codon:yes gene_type:complete
MPAGNKHMYGSGYIMGQMSKQGEFSDAKEDSLYREKMEFGVGTKTGKLTEDFPAEPGSKHMGQASMIMASSKQGI